MRRSIFTASAAALLLSSGAVLAQEAQQSGQTSFDNVFVDVDGSAVQVPVDLAAEACALDVTTLQQVAQTRLDEAGMTASSIPGLMMADAGSAAGLDASGGVSDIEASPMDAADAGASMDSAGAPATGGDMATVDASTVGVTEGTGTASVSGTDGSPATADASSSPVDGSQPAQVDDSGVMSAANSPAGSTSPSSVGASGATDTATADASGTDSASTDLSGLSGVASTAADTTATDAQGSVGSGLSDQYLDLAVCQIDATRASELGISGMTNSTATE
jgi:hypothetical protein